MSQKELEAILRDNYSLVRAVCWRILRDESDTDDATQNALISIARGYPSFDGRSAIGTWIYRIATNAALDELRRRRRRRFAVVDRMDRFADVADPTSLDSNEAFESRDDLNAALALVPEEFRVPLVLRDVADLEYEDIASILAIPPGTVRSRISRGRARLAEEWSNLQGNPGVVDERPNGRRDESHDRTRDQP